MSNYFQQSVLSWYGIVIPDHEANDLFKPLSSMVTSLDAEPLDSIQWVYLMQRSPATEHMRLAVLELCWRIANQWKEIDSEYALPWLALWESLHHARAEYSKVSGCDEYALVTKFGFVPMHDAAKIDAWKDWLAAFAKNSVVNNTGFEALMPFMAHYSWLDAIANACPSACEHIEDAIALTFNDSQPSSFYTQHQWVVWCFRHRNPSSTYDSKNLMHRLFSTHSLFQLALFWNSGKAGHPDGWVPREIPELWRRPLFSGSDITNAEDPIWYRAWLGAIATPNWPSCLSFWVTLVRIRRTNSNPPWLTRTIQDNSAEWRFFETTHSWMSQMPMYLEPQLTDTNMDTFTADCLNYEYVLARALWTIYNSKNKESIDTLPLPNLEY